MIGRFRKQFEIFKNPAAAPAACADIAHFLGIGGLKNQAGLFRLIEYLDSLLLIDRTSQPVFLVISSSQAKNQAGLKRPVTACAHHLVLPSAYAWSDYDFILAGNDLAGLLIRHYHLFGRQRAGNGNSPKLRDS